jgi:hypothetical protein
VKHSVANYVTAGIAMKFEHGRRGESIDAPPLLRSFSLSKISKRDASGHFDVAPK